MACSKYILTNTGSTIVTFNYRRCDDSMWEYQVELEPNQIKNIWLINGTYSTANTTIVLENQGAFPPSGPTPTPTPTPSGTPAVTSTPTGTPEATGTPTPTGTPGGTPEVTTTPTTTPTPTNIVRTGLGGLCHSEATAEEACDCVGTATIFVNGTSLADSTLAWSDSVGPNSGDPTGYYMQDNIVYYLNGGCGIGCITGATITVVGPCGPTPTPTGTPTPTPNKYSFDVSSGSTANDACASGIVGTIWGDAPLFDDCLQFYPESSGPSDMIAGFYVNNNIVTEIDATGAQVGAFSSCAVVPTVTPTATPEPTPTATLSYYTYNLGTGLTSSEACVNFVGSPEQIYGTIAGGPGPNIGETLFADTVLSIPVSDGFYSNGTGWFQVSGGSGLITGTDPNGC